MSAPPGPYAYPFPPPPPPPPRRRSPRAVLIVALVAVLAVVALIGTSCVAMVAGVSDGMRERERITLGHTATPDQARARVEAMAQRVATTSLPPGTALGPVSGGVTECESQSGAVAVYAYVEVLGLPASADAARGETDRRSRAVRDRWGAGGYTFDRWWRPLGEEEYTTEHWRTPAVAGDVPGSTATMSVTHWETGPPVRMTLGAQSECLWPTGDPPPTR